MIDKEEINRQTQLDGLRFDQVEKDHVILWILSALSQPQVKPEGWIFKGGTCLRHCFYAGYRFSEDLDFSCRQMPGGIEKVEEILGGMGLTHDEYLYFRDTLEENGSLARSVMFVHTAADPAGIVTLPAEILQEVEQKSPELFCIGFIPPSGLSASRHLSKLLRARLPELPIVVGHWGLHEKVQNDRETLLAAGVTHVAATLIETRDQIAQALHPHVRPQPEPPSKLHRPA
jgi:hypothetical protein